MSGKRVMSSHSGSFNLDVAIKMVENEQRKVVYTFGYKWKCPGTMEVPITKEKAIDILQHANAPDINDLGWALEIQDYHTNDFW